MKQIRRYDIYSIAMLMWEISSGQLPFANYEHGYNLAMEIVSGMRPKNEPGTPLKYKELMEQCWKANPKERPETEIIKKEIKEINKSYQNTQNELKIMKISLNNSLKARKYITKI